MATLHLSSPFYSCLLATMLFFSLAAAAATAATMLPLTDGALNLVLSNDDGWAEINIREFYYSLTSAGFNVIISAPTDNMSGTGSSDAEPVPVGNAGCEYRSCEPGSAPTGYNASEPRFNYVNSYPVTSMRYGIQTLSPIFFRSSNGVPDLAVSGFNVGSNLGRTTLISGTVGAATEAVKEGIPAIAFSGRTGAQTAWNAPVETYERVYADLATFVTASLTNAGKPYLPANIWLNVNFPSVRRGHCDNVADYKFVLTRIMPPVPFLTPRDVEVCGNRGRLPTEASVVLHRSDCFASISVGVADTKGDAGEEAQRFVLERLQGILSCLP